MLIMILGRHLPVGLLGPWYFKSYLSKKNYVYDLLLMVVIDYELLLTLKLCLFYENLIVYVCVSHSSVGPCSSSRLPFPDVGVNGYKVSSFVPFYLKMLIHGKYLFNRKYGRFRNAIIMLARMSILRTDLSIT